MSKTRAGQIASREAGFTLIELLVVISIIGLLGSIIVTTTQNVRIKGRDSRRLGDMRQIQTALEFYYDKNGQYPDSDFQGCGTWDTPGDGDFITPLRTANFLAADPKDPRNNYDCGNYRYYRYNTTDNAGCIKSAYYVLGVVDMESSPSPYPASPGFKCEGAGNRNWQNEMDWVTGAYEK